MHPQSPALRALAEKWDAVPAAERANYQLYINELCGALGVAQPGPTGSGYEFEYPVTTTARRAGKDTTNFIDLYRPGHFILIARNVEARTGMDPVFAPAYGAAKRYARQVAHGPPPYVMVMNVGRRLLYWDRWRGGYAGLNAGNSIDLRPLWMNHGSIELLRALWDHPGSLDPNGALKRMVPDLEIAYRAGNREIILRETSVTRVIEALWQTRTTFHFFDPLYPSPSDPGAYITCTPRDGSWGMKLGNHGWSGGEYSVETPVVCIQLRNLLARGLLSSIVI